MRFTRAFSRTFISATAACALAVIPVMVAPPAHAAGLGELSVTTSSIFVPNPNRWRGEATFTVIATSLDGATRKSFDLTTIIVGPTSWTFNPLGEPFPGNEYCIISARVTGESVSAAWSGSVCTSPKPPTVIVQPEPAPTTPRATPQPTSAAPRPGRGTAATPATKGAPPRSTNGTTPTPPATPAPTATESPTTATATEAGPAAAADEPDSSAFGDLSPTEQVDGERPVAAPKPPRSGDRAGLWLGGSAVLALLGMGVVFLRRFD